MIKFAINNPSISLKINPKLIKPLFAIPLAREKGLELLVPALSGSTLQFHIFVLFHAVLFGAISIIRDLENGIS
jgi:hypothetical protein